MLSSRVCPSLFPRGKSSFLHWLTALFVSTLPVCVFVCFNIKCTNTQDHAHAKHVLYVWMRAVCVVTGIDSCQEGLHAEIEPWQQLQDIPIGYR